MPADHRAALRAGRVPIAERGPGGSYRPDDRPPSIFGEHQPGIVTPRLERLRAASYDLAVDGRTALRDLLVAWSAEAERLMTGAAAPRLTLTFGLGPGVFDTDRYGLRAARPVALAPLPAFAGDALDPARCGGDLYVQACADDPDLSAEALARITGIAAGAAARRWAVTGFLHRGRRDRPGGTPRDLFGFKDGTANPRRGRDLDRQVWAGTGDRGWLRGGTYLVVRRIRLDLAGWRRLPAGAQERAVGRHRDSGAPLGRTREYDPLPPDLPADAHVRLAAAGRDAGEVMLRRGYSYDDGAEAGLLFLAYQRDPRRQFVPVQRRLASRDALSGYATHVGSALFAVPPGARPGGFVADRLPWIPGTG